MIMEIQAKLKGAAFLLHSTSSFSQVFGMLLQVAETNGGHQTNYLSWKISLKALPFHQTHSANGKLKWLAN